MTANSRRAFLLVGVWAWAGGTAPASAIGPGWAGAAVAAAQAREAEDAALRKARGRHARMVSRVAALPSNGRAQELARRRKMQFLNVLWEDTGRWQGSAVGPNISDVTIEVEHRDAAGRKRRALMPVLRHPNFTDKTGDVNLDKIMLPFGNERAGGGVQHVSLRQFLAEPGRYLSEPQKGRIRGGSLLAPRDQHALVSAQATFLPVPEQGTATFWPVIFNYQSTQRNPAVLTLLVTRQGTSVTVIDNTRDAFDGDGGSWGQRLFFNAAGRKAPLSAERLSAVERAGVTSNGEAAESLGDDANLLMLIQVPLKVRPVLRGGLILDGAFGVGGLGGAAKAKGAPTAAAAESESSRRARSDVEVAVLGHGPEMGPFVELGGLTIARDPRFPVRVTVQFYQATSNGVVDAQNLTALAAQIDRVYASADYVGSLVVPSAADRQRPTNWVGVTRAPDVMMWTDFAGLAERYRVPPSLARTE